MRWKLMETFLWIVASASVIAMPLLVLAGMSLLKGGNAHARKIAHEQEQLDKKNGVTPKPHTQTPGEKKKGEGSKPKLNLVTVLLVVFGVAIVLYFGVKGSPSLGTAWAAIKNHWLPILLGIALAYVLSYLIKKENEPLAKAIRVVLVFALPVLFIGLPLTNVIWGEKSPSVPSNVRSTSREEIPLTSMPQSSWPKLVIPEGGQSYVPRPSGMHIVTAGLNYTSYAMYSDGHECSFKTSCPEGSLGANVRNESTKVNVVSYAFAPD